MNLKKQLVTFGLTAMVSLSAFAGAAAQDVTTSSSVDGTANLEIPVCYISKFSADDNGRNDFGDWQKEGGLYVAQGDWGDSVMEFSFHTDHTFTQSPPEMAIMGGEKNYERTNKCSASFTASLTHEDGAALLGPELFSASFDDRDWVNANVSSALDNGDDHDLQVRLNSVPAANPAGSYTGPVEVTLSVGE